MVTKRRLLNSISCSCETQEQLYKPGHLVQSAEEAIASCPTTDNPTSASYTLDMPTMAHDLNVEMLYIHDRNIECSRKGQGNKIH